MPDDIVLEEIPTDPTTKYYRLYHRVERLRSWLKRLIVLQLLLFILTVFFGSPFLLLMFINAAALLLLTFVFIVVDHQKAKQLTQYVVTLEPDTTP